jgi:hypothetical protein
MPSSGGGEREEKGERGERGEKGGTWANRAASIRSKSSVSSSLDMMSHILYN